MVRKIVLVLGPAPAAAAAYTLCGSATKGTRLRGQLAAVRASLKQEEERAEAVRAGLDRLTRLEDEGALGAALETPVSDEGDELDGAFEGELELDLREALPDRRAAARWAGPLVQLFAQLAELELTEVETKLGGRRASLAEAIEAVRAAARALGVSVAAPDLRGTGAHVRRTVGADLYDDEFEEEDEDDEDDGDGDGDEDEDDDDDDEDGDDGDDDDDFPPGGFGAVSPRETARPRAQGRTSAPPPPREPGWGREPGPRRLVADLSAAERDFLQRAGLSWPCEAEALRKGRLRVLAAAHPDRHQGRAAAAHEDYLALQASAASLRARLCPEPHRAAR